MSIEAQAGPTTPPVRLPVWRLLAASFASVFHHLDNFIARVWPWVVITAVLAIVLGGVLEVRLDYEHPETAVVWLMLLPYVAGSFMVVVSWHRGLLLGEEGGANAAFRLDRPLWRYIGITLRFLLILLACVIPIAIVLGIMVVAGGPNPESGLPAIALLTPLFMLALLPIGARYLLAFPMAAVDARPPLLRGSWRLTYGNTWRLTAALLIVQIFGQALSYGTDFLLAFVLGMLGLEAQAALIVQPFHIVIVLLGTGLAASLASYAYAVLTNHPLGREVTG